MNDYHIRTSLKQKLAKQYADDPHTAIIEELGLRHGEARIDLAVVNGYLHGYELKSDKDNLERLPKQSRIYSLIFDRLTLVVSHRHTYSALKIIPEWWGIDMVEQGARGKIKFHHIRKVKNNPKLDAIAILELLWKNEAIDFLDEIRTAKGVRSKKRLAIYERIAAITDIDLIRTKTRDCLRNRLNWRVDPQQMLSDD